MTEDKMVGWHHQLDGHDPLSEGNRLRPDTERTPLYGCRRGKLEVIEG